MDKQKRFKRLNITRILKRKQKPAALKKSASLQQVWDQFMGCLTIKEENAKQTKTKDHSVLATMPEEDRHTPVKSSLQNASSIVRINKGIARTNANFPVPVSEYVPAFSSPYLGLQKRNKRLLFSGRAFAGLEQSAGSYSGLGGADLKSVDEDALVLDDGQPDDHSQIGISVHQQNDTQLTEGTEETKNRFTEIEDETENCFVEIEEDTSEGDDQERQTRNTALNLKSTSRRQINITQLNARFPGTEDSSHLDIHVDHNRNNGGDHQRPQSIRNDKKLEWMFVITNFCLEVVSTVLDQLSSVHKPLYALLGMLFSFGAMLVCIVELVVKGRKEKVTWRWKGMKLPWFYYPIQSHDRLAFGTFKDIIGFACALCQCIVTTINYACVNKPIKISVWPIIFAFGQLCSKILENPEKTDIV
ncbi:hypothetical protein ACOSQ3_004325 [Xanthoceras sorbifolium]